MSETLTAAEEAEFTLLNCLAFDNLRVESQARGSVPACWLCMSEEAKATARRVAMDRLGNGWGQKVTEENFGKLTHGCDQTASIAKWRAAELALKQMRAEGNPQAFFAV